MPARPETVRDDEDDFLAFWVEHRASQKRENKRILGVEVEVPHDIPLSFEDTINALSESGSREDLGKIVKILFGSDILDQWLDRDITRDQFQVIVMWAMANAGGRPTTFAEAAQLNADAEAKKAQAAAEGKAVPINRAARRASSKTGGSGGTGRSSKRTSRANTA